jgi:hypothetical protein
MSEPAAALRPAPFLSGLARVTSATLALEVLDTRLLSVITWYSFAYLVIAMGLCGLTAGAVRVYLAPLSFQGPELAASLAKASRQFAYAVPLSLALLLVVPLTTAPVTTTVFVFLAFAAALALPFYPAGIVVAAALTRTSFAIGRVYAVDLVGAALGAPLVPLLLRHLGGESAILFVGAIAAAGSIAFAMAGGDRGAMRHGGGALVLSLVLCAGNTMTRHGLKPIWAKGHLDSQDYALEMWNSHSRVRVWNPQTMPGALWGPGARCAAPNVRQHIIEIDAAAGTTLYEAPDGIDSLGFLACDVTSVPAFLRPGGASAVIGVGGSRDLQIALLTKHAPVYGIEFNGRLLDLLHGPIGLTSRVPNDPAIRLIEDEGRSYLGRTPEKFRLIQASLVDTWAATGAGAHALGENGLYTIEAWRTFLDKLEPDGVFTVSRWTLEMERVASLAVGTMIDAGVEEPRRHIALIGTSLVVTLILGKAPLTPADIDTLSRISEDKGFVLVAPDTLVDGALGAVLDAKSRVELDRATLAPDLDNRPPTDDRPYFFNVLPIEAAFKRLPIVNMGSIEGNQLATRTLVLSFFASLVVTILAILVPLYRRARPSRSAGAELYAGILYFSLIGAGFMLAEIALLQRLGLLLGQPTYSLIVVLASLIGFTGVGSLLSDRLPLAKAPYRSIFPLVIAAVLVVLALAWGAVAPRVVATEISVRIAFAVGITSALGVLLGLAFPTGIRLVSRVRPDETPWLWGVNGAGSVLASSLAVMIAQRWGLSAVLLVSAACYAARLVPIRVLSR